jgi:glucokinase
VTFLVFDVGGTRTKAAVVTGDGAIAGRLIEPTAADAAGALAAVERVGKELLDGRPCAGTGACVPGLVDEAGVVLSLPGKLPGMEGQNVRAHLTAVFAASAIVVNDAVAYATGETVAGAGHGFNRVVVVTIGTGVGVTAVENGAPVTRGTLGAGILGGFIPISAATDGPRDSSGNAGTIEALCAASRIGGSDYSSPEAVYAAYAAGEEPARAHIDRYRIDLTRALVALAHAHAPEAIVLGGGPMVPDAPVLDGLEDAVNARLFGSYGVRVRIASLGDDAALLGLAHLIRGGE